MNNDTKDPPMPSTASSRKRLFLGAVIFIAAYIGGFFLFTKYVPGEEKNIVIDGRTMLGVRERYRYFSGGWQQTLWLPMWPLDRHFHTGVEWVNGKP